MSRKKHSGRRATTTIRTKRYRPRSSPKNLAKLAEELHSTVEKEVTDVSTPVPKPAPPTSVFSESRVIDRLDALEQRLDSHWERINALLTNYGAMSARVNRLESFAPKRDEKETITGMIFDFLRKNKGLKFNTGSVAANVESVTSDSASTLLRLLINKYPNNVKFEKKEGQSGMFWYEDSPIDNGEKLDEDSST